MRPRSGSEAGPGSLVYGVTIPLSARIFLRGQLNLLARRRGGVYLMHGTDEPGPVSGLDPRVTQIPVEMARDPKPVSDLAALVRVLRVLREIGPDVILVGTPKMGLLGLLPLESCACHDGSTSSSGSGSRAHGDRGGRCSGCSSGWR